MDLNNVEWNLKKTQWVFSGAIERTILRVVKENAPTQVAGKEMGVTNQTGGFVGEGRRWGSGGRASKKIMSGGSEKSRIMRTL